MKGYSNIFLVIWFIPILGLLTSIVVPSVGGMFGWAIATAVFYAIPMFAGFVYVILFGLPPETYEYISGLFTTV